MECCKQDMVITNPASAATGKDLSLNEGTEDAKVDWESDNHIDSVGYDNIASSKQTEKHSIKFLSEVFITVAFSILIGFQSTHQ